MSGGQRRRQRTVIAVLLCLAVALLWWWRRDRPEEASNRVVAGSPALGAREPGGPSARPHAPRLADEGAPADPPIIDRVTVEKSEVCQGEENLVTVTAHTPGGKDDAYLHGIVAGSPGMSVPLRSYLQKDGSQPEPRVVTVFGRQNVPSSAAVPSFTVKDCIVERKAVVTWRLRPNTDAEFDLRVQIVNLSATEPFEAVAYQWEFGDGEVAETEKPWVIHDYGRRPQGDALISELLVKVLAKDKSGEALLGRNTLVLRNAAFANLAFAGVVTLSSAITPRFPVVDEDGVIRQRVRLWHYRPAPVHIDRVRLRRNRKSGGEPEMVEGSVADVLGTSEIPPEGIEIAVELDTERDPDLFSVDYLLEGKSAEGYPVRGVFPIMTPTALPTKDRHIPVRDPLLEAKIKRAREILDKRYVTDEDIWALERDGAFGDLAVSPGPAAGTTPPSYGDLAPHPPRSGEPTPDTPLVDGTKLPALDKPQPEPPSP